MGLRGLGLSGFRISFSGSERVSGSRFMVASGRRDTPLSETLLTQEGGLVSKVSS